ncbi:MAG: hypothetical protein HRU14_05740 [Planctomycetes bacterium]|nr:hypothetical protein [Planctomycetota bacterium]
MDRRALVCLVFAALLLVAIVLSAQRLSSLRTDDASLERAKQHLAAGSLGRALAALRELDEAGRLTEKQTARLGSLTIRTVLDALGRHHPIQNVGRLSFDAEGENVLVVGLNPIRVSGRIRPPELVGTLTALKFGDRVVPLQNDSVFVDLDLDESGKTLVLPITAVIAMPDGSTVSHKLDGDLHLRLDQGCPNVAVTVGEGRPVAPAADGSTRILVPPGVPVAVDVSDERGLASVSWAAGDDEGTLSALQKSALHVALPRRVTASAGERQVEVTASNQLYTVTTATFTLDVKDERWLPVTEVRLSDTVLSASGVVVAGIKHQLRVLLDPGTPPDVVRMSVRSDITGAVPLRVDGAHLIADVKLKPSGKTGISLLRGSAVLRTWVVQVDTSAPTITVRVAGKALHPDTMTVLEDGAVIEVVVQDPNGLGPVHIVSTGLSPAGFVDQEKSRKSEVRRLRLSEDADGGITVQAEDRLGNATAKLSFPIRARRPVQLRTFKVNGVDVGLDAISVTHGKVKIELTHGGEGVIAWTLIDPRSGTIFKRGKEVIQGDGSTVLTVALDVADQAMAERELRLMDEAGGRHLATAKLRVDHVSPAIRVGTWNPERDGPRDTFEATPGARLEIAVTEAGGDVEITVTGTVVLSRKKEGDVVTLLVGVPEVLPASMVIRARDTAGNVTGLAFKLVTPSVVPAVIVDLIQGGELVRHDGPIQVKRPSDLLVKVTNGTIVRASFGGSELPLSEGGVLGDPATPPNNGPLAVVVRDIAGKERTIRFLAELIPYSVPKALKDRFEKARESLANGRREEALKEATAIEKEVREGAKKHLLLGERGHFLDEIRRLREEGQRGPGGDPPGAGRSNSSNPNGRMAIGAGDAPGFSYRGQEGPRPSDTRPRSAFEPATTTDKRGRAVWIPHR